MSDIHRFTGKPGKPGNTGNTGNPGKDGSLPRVRKPKRHEPLDRHELLPAILAMVGGALGTGLLTAAALLLLLVQDACTPERTDCSGGMFVGGFFLALLIPPLIAVAGFLTTAVFLQRRRPRPWRVPLLALAASAVVWLVGAIVCFVSVPGYGPGDWLGSIF
jgi:uncharacterized BrkB/YihY/UPF0761 family membrane protein